jgi:NADH-quinone oxidoreductase subunit J
VAEVLFYVLAIAAIAFGAGVVVARVPLFSVLSLLGAFFALSGIYLLIGFPFLAAVQLLVYAGAIMVLFLFVIMLLDLGNPASIELHEGGKLSGRRLGIAAVAAGALGLGGIVAAAASASEVPPAEAPAGGLDALDALARELFSRYALPFEAASVLLLATMIAVLLLAKRQREPRHHGMELTVGKVEPAETHEVATAVAEASS